MTLLMGSQKYNHTFCLYFLGKGSVHVSRELLGQLSHSPLSVPLDMTTVSFSSYIHVCVHVHTCIYMYVFNIYTHIYVHIDIYVCVV